MATGNHAFIGATTAVIFLNKPPTPPSQTNPNLPPELGRIISKALEKDRHLRYQHASDIRTDLKRLKRDTDSGGGDGVRSAAVSAAVAGASRSRPEEEHGQDARATAGETPALHRWRRGVAVAAGVLVLAALLVTVWLYLSPGHNRPLDSVAVLPFVNESHDPNSDYLSDGITESIIDSLSQLPNLRVMGRSTVFRYKGKETNLLKAGQELKVAAVLTGREVPNGTSA